jgi:tetratricopeptide (TPR) repeat protein
MRKSQGTAPSRPAAARSGSSRLPWHHVDPGERAAWLFGLLAALIALGFFVFPLKVDPMEALALCAALVAFAVVLAGASFRAADPLLLRQAAGPGALAVLTLAVWAVLRWRLARFPDGPGEEGSVAILSVGRDGVIALQLLAFSFLLGLGLSTLSLNRALVAWRVFRGLLILSAFGFALLALYQFFIGYDAMLERLHRSVRGEAVVDPLLLQSLEHALRERRVGGTLGNGNIYAAWLAILAGLCLSLGAEGLRSGLRLLGLTGYVLAAFALLLTGSRGGMLTLLVSTTLALALLWRGGSLRWTRSDSLRRRPFLAAFSLVLAAATFLIAQSAWAIDVGYRLTRITTIRERLNYWSVAVEVWMRNPLAGGGPGSFELFYPRFKPPTARESRFAHSWFFHCLAELGIVGLVLLCVFLIAVAGAALIVWRDLNRPSADATAGRRAVLTEARWLALICAVLVFNGLFEYSLQLAEFLILLGLASGGLLGLSVQALPAPTPTLRLAHRAALTALLALASLGFCLWLVPRSQLALNWEWRGRNAMTAREPEEAARAFAHASRWLPADEGLLLGWSAALAQLPDRSRDAEALLRKAQELNPLSARIRLAQSRFYEQRNQTGRALEKVDEAVALYPTDAGYRINRARLRHGLGLDDGARDDLLLIESQAMPVWTYQRSELDALRVLLGLGPSPETLKERERTGN